MSEPFAPDDPFAIGADDGAPDADEAPAAEEDVETGAEEDVETGAETSTPEDPFAAVADAASEEMASEAIDDDDVGYEVPIGGTESGIASNNALRSLARAARSFLLYEPRNQAIRDFLSDYREMMTLALQDHGAMKLEIRPFEMVRGSEVVYLERERERSLAFRLFRDGVRRLSIEPEVEWSELLRLLEILSIRYTGIRQQEDDIVTLLWKAGFKHITIAAVEGFVPEEEQAVGGLSGEVVRRKRRKRRDSVSHVDAPHDWDQPIPSLAEPAPLVYREVPEERLVALRAETSSYAMPQNAVRVIERLLVVVADPTDPTQLSDMVSLIGEIRDFLLSEGQLEWLTRLVAALEEHRSLDPELMEALISKFSDARALRRIFHSIGKAVESVPPELITLLDLIESDHLIHLADLLAEERAPAARRINRMLIERYLERSGDPSYLVERLRGEEPGVMADLLRSVSHVQPEAALKEAVALAGHPASEIQLEVLWVVGRSDDEDQIMKTLMGMLRSTFEEVRIRVLAHVELYGSAEAFPMLEEHAKYRSTRRMSRRECEATGVAMARVDSEQALKVFSAWIKPPGLFKRMVEMPGAQALQWTAVTGLGLLPGEKVDKLVSWLSDRAGEELYKHCMMTLVRRRREGLSRA
jgi:hypothetical protein